MGREPEAWQEKASKGKKDQERNGRQRRGDPKLWVRSHKGRKASKQVKLAERGDSAEQSPGRRGNGPRLVETKSIVVVGIQATA